MNNDNVVILNPGFDDDQTVFQTEEDRKKLAREILGIDVDDTDLEIDVDTTVQMNRDAHPFRRQVFG